MHWLENKEKFRSHEERQKLGKFILRCTVKTKLAFPGRKSSSYCNTNKSEHYLVISIEKCKTKSGNSTRRLERT